MFNILMGYALMGIMFDQGGHSNYRYALTKEEIEELKKARANKAKQMLLDKGCKEFDIDGFKIIALNEKNAIRKINNIKKQLSQITDENF